MNEQNPNPPSQESVELSLFEKHRDLFNQYAGTSIHVELAPPGLDTFAFDLEKNTIYLSPRFYRDKFSGDESDRFTVYAILHEIGHFREKLEMMSEEGGLEDFQRYLEKIKKDKAFSLIDNLIADISINREVNNRTSSSFRQTERQMYETDLFPETDFTQIPKHIQFGQALLREHRLPEEKCIVADEVRVEIDNLRKGPQGDIVDIMTDPDVSMSMRLKVLERFIMPIVDKLRQQDLEDKKQQQKQKGDKGQGGDPKPGQGSGSDIEEANKIFDEDYKKAKKVLVDPTGEPDKNPDEDPTGDPINKALKEYLEKNPGAKSLNKRKTKKEIQDDLDKQEANEIGVNVDDLRLYKDIKTRLEDLKDPETNRTVIEELSALFARIISKRKSERWKSKAPVEEGPYLSDPANLIADVKSGTLKSYSWEDQHKKPKESKKYGEIELSFIFDRSGSMEGDGKKTEQRRAAVLIMEALTDFENQLKNAKLSGNLNEELNLKNEIFSFQSSSDDARPLKALDAKLTERKKIEIAKKLSSTSGSTTDFVPLQMINNSLGEMPVKKIKEGKLKKIVIVMTDGGSDNKTAVKNVLDSLGDKGVIVVGVGITQSGLPAIETYKPRSVLAAEAKNLPNVLVNILKEHLADL